MVHEMRGRSFDEGDGSGGDGGSSAVIGQPMPLVFNGRAGEYFGIWIVNVLLTVLTVGIYSAWAKVRTNRYFWGSTRLDGDAFSYHAKPLQILIARIIVIAVLVGVGVLVDMRPIAAFVVYPAFLFLFPWLVARSFRFQSRVTRWRNVNFDFRTDYWPTFLTLLIVPFIPIISLGLATPVATKLTQEWAYNRFSFGDRPFKVDVSLGRLYGLFGLVFVLAIVAYGAALASLIPVILEADNSGGGLGALGPGGYLSLAVAYVLLLSVSLLVLVYQVGVRNIVFSELTLDGIHKFQSTVSKTRYVWIVVTNLFAVAFTLGLLTPWARIRLARYIAENTYIIPGGPLDEFVANVKETQGVIGEEYVDIEGIDVGIGL
ncbi:MAG: YjgN family protein [Pseudomonadota bacterium]